MSEHTKRFSLRHGIEVTPTQPIFDDAPERLRFFVLEFLKNNFYDYIARGFTARVLCVPDLLISNVVGPQCWSRLHPLINKCEWWQLFNMLEEIHTELSDTGYNQQANFVEELNEVFGEESIGWRMTPKGRLERQLPEIASAEELVAFKELQAPHFATALAHLHASRQAYNFRPRRDREVCSEAFDALESVAKEIFALPTGTFGDAIKTARTKGIFSAETLSVMEKIYALANNHFRHGMTTPFALTAAEVEFVYLSCIGGILMLARLP